MKILILFVTLLTSLNTFASPDIRLHDYSGPAHVYAAHNRQGKFFEVHYNGYIIKKCETQHHNTLPQIEALLIFPREEGPNKIIVKKLNYRCNSPYYFARFPNKASIYLSGEQTDEIWKEIFSTNENGSMTINKFQVAFKFPGHPVLWDSNFGNNWEISLSAF